MLPHLTPFKQFPVAKTLGLILSVAFAVVGQTPRTDEARELPPTQTLERQMTGAETHRYKISLQKDEFFQVRVEQKGVDVALKLVDINGKTLATMDSPNDKEGPETLSLVAAAEGSYILEVSGFDAKAERGNYTIRREASRTATAGDKKRVAVERILIEGITARDAEGQSELALTKLEEALRGWQELKDNYLADLTARQIKQLQDRPKRAQADALYDEAIALSKQGTRESLQNAAYKFSEAQRVYAQLEDKPNEAITLNQIGYIYGLLAETQKALDYFNKSLPLYKDIGDKHGETNTLNNIGRIYAILGEPQKALDYYRQSLPIVRSIADKTDSDKRLEARTLYNTGGVYSELSDARKALEYLTLALSLCREIADRGGEATTLNNFGTVYSNLGEKQKALDYYNQALALIRTSVSDKPDKSLEAITLNNIAGVYADLGEPQKALEYYNQVLPIRRTIGDRYGEANTLNNFGSVYSHLGEKQKGLDYYNQALTIIKAVGDRKGEASTLSNIGVVYSSLGENQKALDYYSRALLLHKAVANRKGQIATLSNIGRVYADLSEKQKALEYYQQALLLSRAIDDRSGEATILNSIGVVYWDLGENQKALEYYNRSLPVSKTVSNREGEANTLNNIGAVHYNLGEYQKAIEYFNQVLPISKAVGDRSGEAVALANEMFSWESLNNRRLAILYGKQAVNVYQSLRADIKGLDKNLQQSFLGAVEDTYRKLAELLIKESRIPEAERILAMLKEKEYSQFVRGGGEIASALDKRINLSSSEKDALERYDKIADQLTQLGSEYGRLETEKNQPNVTTAKVQAIIAQQKAIDDNLTLARTTLDKFLEALKKEFSQEDKRIAAVEEGLLAEVKSWSDPHVVVISTIVGKENLSIIVTTPDIQTAHIVPISEEKLSTLVGDFRAALTDPTHDPKSAGQKLYEVLIKPLQKDLDGVHARTLVWSLDGILRYAPMSALWDADKGFLIQRYANVVITLASRGNLAELPKDKIKWQALGVGVSKAVGEFNALSYVPGELSALVRDPSVVSKTNQKGVMTGRRLLDEQFTYDAFRSNLGRFRIVHAATHFSFISGVKAESLQSFLLMGNGEKLTLAKIQSSGTIFNDVQLLTLSACDTAYGGKDADGREVEGFGAMAQKKGAKAVIATLWRVDDESTRDLMVSFYSDYQKPSFNKAEALRQAQLALLQEPDKAANGKTTKSVNASPKRFAHPYYWSPFILIGNWQ